MARGKLTWILLVSFALTGIVAASDGEADSNAIEGEDLVARLRDDSLTIEQVSEMLRTYENQDVEINGHTVAVLVDMCNESLDKCTFDKYWQMVFMAGKYREDIPKLNEYLVYCRRDKMKKYCRDNFQQVAENLLNQVSQEEKELVRPYWESAKRAGILERGQSVGLALEAISDAADATADAVVGEAPVVGKAATSEAEAEQVVRRKAYNEAWWKAREEAYETMSVTVREERETILKIIAKDYSDAINSKFGVKISADEEELYLWKLIRAMDHYKNMYSFFRTLNDDLASVPPFLDDSMAETFKFGRIALYFYYEVSPEIFKQLSKSKIVAEWGRRDTRQWEDFVLQTEEQILEGQERRRADRDAAVAAASAKKIEKMASKKKSGSWVPKVLKRTKTSKA